MYFPFDRIGTIEVFLLFNFDFSFVDQHPPPWIIFLASRRLWKENIRFFYKEIDHIDSTIESGTLEIRPGTPSNTESRSDWINSSVLPQYLPNNISDASIKLHCNLFRIHSDGDVPQQFFLHNSGEELFHVQLRELYFILRFQSENPMKFLESSSAALSQNW